MVSSSTRSQASTTFATTGSASRRKEPTSSRGGCRRRSCASPTGGISCRPLQTPASVPAHAPADARSHGHGDAGLLALARADALRDTRRAVLRAQAVDAQNNRDAVELLELVARAS